MLDGLIAEGYCDLRGGMKLTLAEAYGANVRISHRYDRQRAAYEKAR